MSLEETIEQIKREKELTLTYKEQEIPLEVHDFLGQGGEKAHFHIQTPFGEHKRLTIYFPRESDTLENIHQRVQAEQDQRSKIANNPFFAGKQAIIGIEKIFEQDFSGIQTVVTTTPFIAGENLTEINEGMRENNAPHFFKDLIYQLAIMHNAGAIHRDIKPDNVIVLQATEEEKKQGKTRPTAMLIDWSGIRYEGEHHGDYAIGSRIMGAPEQQVDPSIATKRTDVFQMGQTLYWLLVGEYPFDPTDLPENASFDDKRQATIENIISGRYDRKKLKRHTRRAPHYRKIVSNALQASPEKRTKDAEEMHASFKKRKAITNTGKVLAGIGLLVGISGIFIDYAFRAHYDRTVQRIATIEKQGDQYDIFSYTYDGKQRTRLTSTSVKESSAQWLEETLFFQINEHLYKLDTNDTIKRIETERAMRSFVVCPQQQMLVAKLYDVLNLSNSWEIERYRFAYIEGSSGRCTPDDNTFVHADSPIIWDTNAKNVYFRGETNGDLGLVQWNAEKKFGRILIENPEEKTNIPIMASNKNLWYERKGKVYRINIDTGKVTNINDDSPMLPMRGTSCTTHSDQEQQIITYVSKSDEGMFLEQIVENPNGEITILENRRKKIFSYQGHCIGPNNNIIFSGALAGQDANGDGRTTHADRRLQNISTGEILSDNPVGPISLSREEVRMQIGEVYK